MNPNLEPIRLLLVDDEDLIRQGLQGLLKLSPLLQVVGEASNGQTAVELAAQLNPDVVLMDLRMPLMDGITATQQLKLLSPQIKILILTSLEEDEKIVQAMSEGAQGYILKNTPLSELTRVIQSIYLGSFHLGPGIGQKLMAGMRPNPNWDDPDWSVLTPREQEIARLIGQGASNSEIAQTLSITDKTVKNHVSNILGRLAMRDRTQVALWVTRSHAPPC